MKRRTFLTSALLGAGTTVLPGQSQAQAHTSAAPKGELTVQTTEGPYYLALDLMRADITEGLAGIPLDIVLTVTDAGGRPCEGSLVDVWHCDASGNYSGFAPPGASAPKGKTFLRGTQTVGADGTVVFHSLYPGWYEGRTTHIHFKVRRGKLTNLTTQFFLPDALSEFLYTQVPAYRRDALRDTLNSTDGIAIEAGLSVHGNVRETDGRYVASLAVRVDPAANPPIDRPPVPGQGFPDKGFPDMQDHKGPHPDGKGGPPGGQRDGHFRGPPPNGKGPDGKEAEGKGPDGQPFGPPPAPVALTGTARTDALLPTAKPAPMQGFGGPDQMPKT